MSVFCLKAAFPSSRNGFRGPSQALESPDFRRIKRAEPRSVRDEMLKLTMRQQTLGENPDLKAHLVGEAGVGEQSGRQ
jgi:hypothetical protein